MAGMERAVEIYAIVNLVVIGLSHVVRARAWVKFFVFLRERGEAGVFCVGILNLIFGSVIVGFHERWTGIPVVLTVLGWASVVKALVYLTFPGVGLRRLNAMSEERAYVIRIAGIPFLVVAGLLTYQVVMG
jgi:hypothetical protein